MREGWSWLTYPKAAHVVAQDPGKLKHRLLRWILQWIPTVRAKVLLKKLDQKLNWAVILIQFSTPNGGRVECYEARVEMSHTVGGQLSSEDSQAAYLAKQYRVVDLRKL